MTAPPLVFISYRRDDSNWATELLFDRLEAVLGKGALFRDVDSIQPGQDFREWINESLEQSRVMLVVIGSQWLHVNDLDGRRRLDQPSDWVRIEIESALDRQIKIIPILLYPATLPSKQELPPSLEKLPYLQAITIYPGEDFELGFQRLTDGILNSLPKDRRVEIQRQVDLTGEPARRAKKASPPWRRILWLTVAVLAVCIALSFRFMGAPHDRSSSIRKRDSTVDQMASVVSDWFKTRLRKLEELAELPALRSNDGPRHQPNLMALAKAGDFPGGVYTLDERGIILAQATPNYPTMDNLRGMNFSHREYFVECQRRNRSVTTNSFISANRRELIVVLATPRKGADGSFIGIVDGVLDVSTAPLSGIAQQLGSGRVNLYLLDANGIVLASNEVSEVGKAFSNLGLLNRFRNHTFDAHDAWEARVVEVSETPYYIIGRLVHPDSW